MYIAVYACVKNIQLDTETYAMRCQFISVDLCITLPHEISLMKEFTLFDNLARLQDRLTQLARGRVADST